MNEIITKYIWSTSSAFSSETRHLRSLFSLTTSIVHPIWMKLSQTTSDPPLVPSQVRLGILDHCSFWPHQLFIQYEWNYHTTSDPPLVPSQMRLGIFNRSLFSLTTSIVHPIWMKLSQTTSDPPLVPSQVRLGILDHCSVWPHQLFIQYEWNYHKLHLIHLLCLLKWD